MSTNIDVASPVSATNGTATVGSPNEESQSAKRKRESEPGRKKSKKSRQEEIENHVGDMDGATIPRESPTSDAEADSAKEKKIRGPRASKTNNQQVGFFLEEEVRKLEAYKIDFCNMHGLAGDTSQFDTMVQHSERDGDPFPCPEYVCTKSGFWAEIYSLLPGRNRRSVYRFMRRHFQQSRQKAHEWTEEQDEELIELLKTHGHKWAHIAKLLGRSADDVTQRWKNRLEHRDKMNHGAWTEDELRILYNTVESMWKMRKLESPKHAGIEIFDMDDKLVTWAFVSDAMNNSRSRQQCGDKWRKIRKRMYELRETGDPNAEFDLGEFTRRSQKWSDKTITPNNKPKSQRFVHDDNNDNDDEGVEGSSSLQGNAKLGFMDFLNSRSSLAAENATPESSSQPGPSSQPQPTPTRAKEAVEVGKSKKSNASKKRNHSEVEPPVDNAEPASSPVKTPTSKSEKKRLKRERKEREQREREEAEEAEAQRKQKEKNEKHKKSAAEIDEDLGSESESDGSSGYDIKMEDSDLE